MTATWRLLPSGPGAPAWNLALDEALLRSADSRPLLRLYAWEPQALSLGYFQPLEPFLEAAGQAGVGIVRRPTGGGAIHHADELTFSIVATPGADGYPADIVPAYRWVHGIVREALAGLGAELVFRGPAAPLSVRPCEASLCFEDTTALDLVDEHGRKVVGSAQRRLGGRVLHHGSIPLSVPTLSPGSGAVSLAAGRPASWSQVAEALTGAFWRALPGHDWSSEIPGPAEIGSARQLAQGRYADPARASRGDARDGPA